MPGYYFSKRNERYVVVDVRVRMLKPFLIKTSVTWYKYADCFTYCLHVR